MENELLHFIKILVDHNYFSVFSEPVGEKFYNFSLHQILSINRKQIITEING